MAGSQLGVVLVQGLVCCWITAGREEHLAQGIKKLQEDKNRKPTNARLGQLWKESRSQELEEDQGHLK